MSADPSPPVPDRPRSGSAVVLLRLYPAAWRARYGDELADLIDERRLSLCDALDLVRGALDAHCNLADVLGEWSARTSRLRSAAVTTFTAWALFCIAVAALAKTTEDRAFVSAAQGHAAVGVSYVVVQGAFILAGLAVLVGGLPVVSVALRQAWQGRDAVLARLLLVPGLAAAAVVAYARFAVRLVPPAAGVHSGPRMALFAGLLVLGGAGMVGTVAAVRATTYRVELPIGLLRWAGWAGLVAAGAISSGVVALATFGWALRTEEPALFGSANGLLATPMPVTYLVVLILGIIAALRADHAAVGALRALRGGQA